MLSYKKYSFSTQEEVEVVGGPGLPVLVFMHLHLEGNNKNHLFSASFFPQNLMPPHWTDGKTEILRD